MTDGEPQDTREKEPLLGPPPSEPPGTRRLGGAALGAGCGAIIPLIPADIAITWNPWFMDAPGLFFVLVMLPWALFGAICGVFVFKGGRTQRYIGATVGLVSLMLLTGLFFREKPTPPDQTQLLVLGIDGATFTVIDEMKDELPNLTRMEAEGTRAILRSMEPTFSPLLWTSMAAGKPPEAHGIQGFHVQANECKVARFWDIAHDAGYNVGLYKWLVTYPPQQLEGFVVPAWLAPGPETHPEELNFVKELELSNRLKRRKIETTRNKRELTLEAIRYGMRFSTLVRAVKFSLAQRLSGPDPERDHFEGQMIRAAMDRDIFVKALHLYDPHVVTFTNYAPDAVGHRFWRYHEPEAFDDVTPAQVERWGEAIRDTYRISDAILGDILDTVGPQTTIVIVSDHGFRALEQGDLDRYLAPRTDRLQARLQETVGDVEIMRLGQKLVVAAKDSTATTQLEKISTALAEWTLGETGEPLYRAEPMPDNPMAVGLSLSVERVSDEMLASETVGGEPLSDYLKRSEAYSGEHHLDGIFYIRGPGIAAGLTADPMQMLDLTPTLLATLGLPPGKDMPGRVFDEAWEQPLSLPEGPHSYDFLVSGRKWTSGQEGVNEAQLRALGYME